MKLLLLLALLCVTCVVVQNAESAETDSISETLKRLGLWGMFARAYDPSHSSHGKIYSFEKTQQKTKRK